ncbi:MAG: murein hydrolase activator EnvC family protein [Gaiellaceae bacterium]
MARRLTLLLALALALAAPALVGAALAGDGLGDQKASVDSQLGSLQGKIAASQRRASALSSQIGRLTGQIHELEGRVGDVSSRLSALQSDLALRQRRLDKLNELFRLQTRRFHYLKHEYTLSVRRLNTRLVAIYKQGDPSTIDLLLAAKSFQDVLDQLDYLGAIANQDKHVATAVATAKREVKAARAKTKTVRAGVANEARAISARVQQAAILRGELLASQSTLAGARSSKSHALVATKAQIASEVAESKALAAASAQLAARIQEAQAANRSSSGDGSTDTSPSPVSSPPTGFIWPLSGPITSPFGIRWGTLHPGIDIGVPTGTPIHAAAAGKVIWCGWMSGYGNLVMIDHGGSLASLYGHQSRIAASCGESVAQGQLIGYVGCTGFCTGPHLHFEIRVNGSPVDPLGYL